MCTDDDRDALVSRAEFAVWTRNKEEVFNTKASNGGLAGSWLANVHGAA